MVRIVCLGGPFDGLECGLDTIERPTLMFPTVLGSVWNWERLEDDEERHAAQWNVTQDVGFDYVTYERSLTFETDEKGNYIYNFKEPNA